ncbi:hypothetical protein [Bowmanella pacifica]|uniref:HPt domain-containing protein n=1 Tax=Bowmanella pacifica TaxID=502051 RepID=A0A917YVL0_9ALTE|nr:hypothetical protein [Bowmanella pacifica]GGO67241.1 hypothetical protein GCM10010982_13230 [Bowmanella pacifica]
MVINLSKLSSHVGNVSAADKLELLIRLSNSLQQRHDEIIKAATEFELSLLNALAHKLKTHALYYGAIELHHICAEAEQFTLQAQPGTFELQRWVKRFSAQSIAVQQALIDVIQHWDHQDAR